MKRIRLSDLRSARFTLLALVAARAVLAWGGFPAAVRCYRLSVVDKPESGSTAPVPPAELPPAVRKQVRIAHRLVRLPGLRATCLPSSLVVARLLRSHGLTPDVVIGVSAGGRFRAHAWVELPGWRFDASALPTSAYREIGRFRAAG